MKSVVESVVVNAPPERVFAAFADIPRAAERISGIARVEMLTDGPTGVGTRWRETRRMYGSEATEEMWIAEFDPPRSYAVEAESHGTRYRSVLTFAPEGGGTRVAMSFEGTPVSFAARLFSVLGGLMAGSVRRMIRADLEDAKRSVEREAGETGGAGGG